MSAAASFDDEKNQVVQTLRAALVTQAKAWLEIPRS
jgi:hypothetical protein